MKSAYWHFPRVQRGYMLSDPIQSEFFTTETVGGVGHALVREAIQNVLDAKLPESSTVTISFKFIRKKHFEVEEFFSTLESHLQSKQSGLQPEAAQIPEDIIFLTVEDFGTSGLEGDPKAFGIDLGAKNNSFFYFWRNVGRSGKTDESRGRWGLGKSVFAAVSRINTFFGVTQRKSDPGKLYLLGQCILRNHTIKGMEFTPYGHYGIFDPEDQNLALPIVDKRANEFCRIFELDRENQSGLSLVVPLPDQEINSDVISMSAIQQYFYPILADKLVISIDGTLITSLNLDEKIANLPENRGANFDPNTFQKLIHFTRWVMSLGDIEYIVLPEPENLHLAPNWSRYRKFFEENVEILQNWRTKFRALNRISFKVPVKVQLIGKNPEIAWFKVYLERDSDLRKAENYYIREGITISGIKTLTQRDMRGMVVIENMPLTNLLGDSENPAHTEWQRDSMHFRSKYVHGPAILTFVKNSLRELVIALTSEEKEVDKDLLKDIFFIEKEPEVENSENKKPGSRKGKDKFPTPKDITIEHSIAPVLLEQRDNGGVTIRRNIESDVGLEQIVVRFAYDVRSGDPFSRYVSFDFQLDKAPIKISGNNYQYQAKNNMLVIRPTEHSFNVLVEGFDLHRDLKIKLKIDKVTE